MDNKNQSETHSVRNSIPNEEPPKKSPLPHRKMSNSSELSLPEVSLEPATPLVIYDDLGFPIETSLIEDYLRFADLKLNRRKEKVKNRWNNYKLTDTVVLNKKKLRAIITPGITPEMRGLMWCHCSGVTRKKENANFNSDSGNYYEDLVKRATAKHSVALDDIDKDIPRTFPDNINFNAQSKEKLRRLLSAYAKRNKGLGYCQSMNYLAAWSLFFMEEEDAFWLLCTIVEDFVAGYYSKNMISIQVANRILNELLAGQAPELLKHLEGLGVALPLVTTKWLLLLYVNSLPSDVVIRIWDLLFIDGIEFLFKTAVAIFKCLEEELLRTDNTVQACKILKERPLGIFDHKTLFKYIAKMTDITSERIELMRIKHKEDLIKEMEDLRQRRNIRELSKLTRFSQKELQELREQFKSVATGPVSPAVGGKKTNTLKRNAMLQQRDTVVFNFDKFAKVFCHIFPRWNENDPGLIQLFKVFDQDADFEIDFRDLMVGLSILTKGTIEERLEMFFKSFDGDNDGLITKDEMLFMLQGVYRNLYVTTTSAEDQRENKRKSLRSFVDLCFLNLDTDSNGRLDFDEFKRLAVIEPQLFECFAFDPPVDDMMATYPPPETKQQQQQTKQEDETSTTATVTPAAPLPNPVAPKLSLADELFFSTKDLFVESLSPPEWEPDKAVTRCPICTSLFVFPVKRRHHCRNCGKVVCNNCSQKSIPLPKFGYYKPVRVCLTCYGGYKEVHSEKLTSPMVNELP